MKKLIIIIFFLTGLSGCAQTMKIDSSRIGENKAALTIESVALKNYVSVPLINSKVVNVDMSEFYGCKSGERIERSDQRLGSATLTPEKYKQTFDIPSEKEIVISANSQENIGGTVVTCSTSLRFTGKKNGTYVFKFEPRPTFKNQPCQSKIYIISENGEEPVENAYHATVKDNGFFIGKTLNLCEKPKTSE